jgi:hypothetical protein
MAGCQAVSNANFISRKAQAGYCALGEGVDPVALEREPRKAH